MTTGQILLGNRVMKSGLAVIDGKVTGLAGCANSNNCSRSVRCIRSVAELTYRAEHECGNSGRFFIAKAVQP